MTIWILRELPFPAFTSFQTKNSLVCKLFYCYYVCLLLYVDILAQNGSPESVQPHLRKCFENVVSLKFGAPSIFNALQYYMLFYLIKIDVIKAMVSAENEKVSLVDDVPTEKEVEGWLIDFDNAMRKTIKKILQRALVAFSKMPREQCIFSHI